MVVLGSLWLVSAPALAITPGNLSLENTATLTYAGNSTGIQAKANVTVNVIAANPTLSTPLDVVKAEGQDITTEITYTVTANNNGEDQYDFANTTLTTGNGLTDISAGGANVDFTGVSYIYKDASDTTITFVELGASALNAEVTSSTTITVPSDGTADNEVNGLAQNDTVVINGTPYQITGTVTDSGSGSVTLTLDGSVTGGVGTGVFERQTFTVETGGAGGVGSQTVAGNSTTYEVTTALNSVLTTPAQGTATDTVEVEIVNITITKYVANVTRPNCTVGTCTPAVAAFDGDGNGNVDYYLTEGTTDVVDARPGEELIYLLRVVTPTDGAMTGAVLRDILPTFTTFNTGSVYMNGQQVEDEGTAANPVNTGNGDTFPLDPDTDGGGLSIQDVNTTPAAGAEGDGDVAADETVNVVYRVTLS
jgi:hypothetical protein